MVFDNIITKDRKKLNQAILDTWAHHFSDQPEIEQCCFIGPATNPDAIGHIEMFGGEFCGNATRCAVWLLTKGLDGSGYIESSGVESLLAFEVKDGEVEIQMPIPKSLQLVAPIEEGFLVKLDGICHIVVTDQTRQTKHTPRQLLTSLLKENSYGVTDWPCVGVTYYEKESNRAQFCVWVKAVDTIFDETACGSGTSAIGIVMANTLKSSITLPVTQPSNQTIITRAVFNNDHITASFIKGKVTTLYDGELILS